MNNKCAYKWLTVTVAMKLLKFIFIKAKAAVKNETKTNPKSS